ncbi:unnamed protein product, partial [Rotaria sp. Silwood1]
EPTDNNETCTVPYQPSSDNSTNTTSWDMWFCYKNQCPTKSQELANCTSGKVTFSTAHTVQYKSLTTMVKLMHFSIRCQN